MYSGCACLCACFMSTSMALISDCVVLHQILTSTQIKLTHSFSMRAQYPPVRVLGIVDGFRFGDSANNVNANNDSPNNDRVQVKFSCQNRRQIPFVYVCMSVCNIHSLFTFANYLCKRECKLDLGKHFMLELRCR